MELATITDLFNAKKRVHNMNFEPKKEQMQIAAHVYDKHDTLGFLPTGYGKTLCFVVNSMITDESTITLIISPLLSLMDNQMAALRNWSFSCSRIAHDTPDETCKRIADGDFSFVFASPESILKPFWRTVFLGKVWQKLLRCIVFDEAHCLSEWGEDFRPEYREMAQLRSFFNVPILAVTATCTLHVRDDIMDILQLHHNSTKIVSKSPNRSNIMIIFEKRSSNEVDVSFDWLIEHIKTHGKNSKKYIIYCRSIDAVSELFLSLKFSLGSHAYAEGVENPDNLFIEMFHKCTHDTSKARILDSFSQGNSTIRVVIATVALGMGIDIRDVDVVVHYGCPKSAVSYWQEAGRCARDGRPGLSVVLYDNFTASLKTTDKVIANIVRNSDSQCIRQNIMDIFAMTEKQVFRNEVCAACEKNPCACESCKCCSYCASKCPCYKGKLVFVKSFISQ